MAKAVSFHTADVPSDVSLGVKSETTIRDLICSTSLTGKQGDGMAEVKLTLFQL